MNQVDVSWIAERSPEVKNALEFYLRGDCSYTDALKLAIQALYQRVVDMEAFERDEYSTDLSYHESREREIARQILENPYLSEDERLRKGEFQA